MRKNRIWGRKTAFLLGVLLTAEAVSCGARANSAGAVEQGVVLSQTAEWTDSGSFRGVLNVKITVPQETAEIPSEMAETQTAETEQQSEAVKIQNTDEEIPESEAMPAILSSEEETEAEAEMEPVPEPEAEAEPKTGAESVAEAEAGMEPVPEEKREAEMESETGAEPAAETEPEAQSTESILEFTTYISEFFLTEDGWVPPEGCQIRQVPVRSREGRETTITGISGQINGAARQTGMLELAIPVVLRREYRYPETAAMLPVTQDPPLLTGMDTTCPYGSFVTETTENGSLVVAGMTAPYLEVPAAKRDFTMVLNQKEASPKAGSRLDYSVVLTNTGEADLRELSLTVLLSRTDLTSRWEADEALTMTDDAAVLKMLGKGETHTLSFSVETGEEISGTLTAAVTAETKDVSGTSLVRNASVQAELLPLRADFTVEKTADRRQARPGDTITYQICIRNTGERTLHSVVSTERFLHANIRAQFVEMEGIRLNGTKTQALIQQILPGESVGLKAVVTLPEELEDQELVNQVIVVTEETGETAIRNQTAVEIQSTPSPTPEEPSPTPKESSPAPEETSPAPEEVIAGVGGDGGNTQVSPPKTGDTSWKEVYEIVMLAAFGVSALMLFRLIRKPR